MVPSKSCQERFALGNDRVVVAETRAGSAAHGNNAFTRFPESSPTPTETPLALLFFALGSASHVLALSECRGRARH